jgi:hypothetical protein
MGLVVPDNATQSSLLEALATKKLSVAILPRTIDILDPVAHLPIDPVAHLPIDLDPSPATDDEEDVSGKSNLLESSTASMTASMTELRVKRATLEDVRNCTRKGRQRKHRAG